MHNTPRAAHNMQYTTFYGRTVASAMILGQFTFPYMAMMAGYKGRVGTWRRGRSFGFRGASWDDKALFGC